MKKLLLLTLAALLAVAALGCNTPGAYNNDTLSPDTLVITPEPTLGEYTGPEVSALPGAAAPEYEIVQQVMFWPEEASESTADYMLSLEYPVFSDAARNAAVELYREELTDRVVNELIPFADRAENEDVPATFVVCELTFAGEYTNIVFNTTERFGGTSDSYVKTIVMDSDGNEVSFYEASGLYTPEAIVSQQIYNIIDRDSASYNGDITQEDIRLALDLYNGFTVTDTGYVLFVAPGLLAPENNGVQSFTFTRAALYPSFVGDLISIEDYERMLPALNALSAGCAEGFEGFRSTPTPLIATEFMTRMLIDSAERVDSLWSRMDETAYNDYYSRCFGVSLSAGAGIADAGDGTYFADGYAYLPNTQKAVYGLTLDDARTTDAGIMLLGVIMYGEPGSLNTGEVAAVEITIALDASSPIGCKLLSAELR